MDKELASNDIPFSMRGKNNCLKSPEKKDMDKLILNKEYGDYEGNIDVSSFSSDRYHKDFLYLGFTVPHNTTKMLQEDSKTWGNSLIADICMFYFTLQLCIHSQKSGYLLHFT